MGYNAIVMIIFGSVILIFGLAYFATKNKENKKTSNNDTNRNTAQKNDGKSIENSYKKNPNANVAKEDIFNFMEFDKIQDDMIIQQNGEKYTAVIKCKGINYSLMSEVEQLAVEEGFMTFLNTLKFPIQLYVQAQSVNLKSNITDYKENMKGIFEEYDDANSKYNILLNSLETTDEELQEAEDERNSILNVLEYGQDIVKYVEKLALNKNMLQRNFYVLVSYYKSELTNASSFNKEELLDICYSELFTRVQNIMSGLTMCSVNGTILKSNEIAELIYSAYNRDDKNYMSVEQALESGFYRLYSTSEDAIMKKHKNLIEGMRQEAEYKAISAINKAIEEGNISTQAEAEDAYDQETSKQAIEIIKKEKLPEKVKQEAKKVVVDEYKKAKKERIQKQEEELENMKKKLAEYKGEELETDVSEDETSSEDNTTTDSIDSIV